MAADLPHSAASPAVDPDLQMGLDLVAHERRERVIQLIKIAVVWAVLVGLMVLILMQLRFDPAYIAAHYSFVLRGAVVTILVSLAAILFATILALLGAVGRLSHNAIAQGVSGLYVSVFRGTPLLIQIFLIYLGLPQIGRALSQQGLDMLGDMLTMDALQAGILALSLNYGAYMTEIFRAGIQSISYGQKEAATAIGMNTWQTFYRVILPQAVRIIIPDIGNQFIAMQKDSALVSFMGIWEITYRANRLARKDTKFMEMFLLAAALYWILTIISSWLEGRLERRMRHGYER